MKKVNFFKTIMACGIALVAMLATGCMAEETKPYPGCELYAEQTDYEVDVDAGDIQVGVISNMTYNISLMKEANWVKFPATASNDDGFVVEYEENTGVPRMAIVHLTIPEYNHADTIYIKQRGIETPFITREERGVILPGSSAASHAINVQTNIPVGDITIETSYAATETETWISNVRLEEGSEGEAVLKLDVTANPSDKFLRKANVSLFFVDGWDNRVELNLGVTQQTSANASGVESTFPELYALANENGVVLKDDILISGYIVSDPASKNMGDNPHSSTVSIDYEACDQIVYMESEDGEYGLMIKVVAWEDNTIFNRFDKVTLCVRGATLYKSTVSHPNDPTYYWLEDISSAMVVNMKACTESEIPEKKMYIKDLTDDDIFTYVKLQDCVLPMRKGPMTPINEGYANATNAHRVAKFAIQLMDKFGSSMYIFTNTTCPYRRTGERLPYGSGEMRGIIVHEKYTRFSYEDNDTGDIETYGHIGRYQIRHTCLEDFAMNKDFKDGYSEMLCEWAFIEKQYEKQNTGYKATAGLLKEDVEKATMLHTFAYPYGNSSYGNLCTNMMVDMTYLGPVGNNNNYPFGYHVNNENGLGVILDDGTDWMGPNYKGVNSEQAEKINKAEAGKGKVPKEAGSAWRHFYNVDINSPDRTECSYLFKFSTKGVQTDVITVTFAMLNDYASTTGYLEVYGPRYWYLEYSLNNTDWNLVQDTDNKGYALPNPFSVPDNVIWAPQTAYWQSGGFKPMTYRLPADQVCDKDMVYVRVRPDKTWHGSPLEYKVAYEPNHANNNYKALCWSGMDYFAVRYNK